MTVAPQSARNGFVLMEGLLALMLFAMVGVPLLVALSDIGDVAYRARREAQLARIVDSELRAAMSLPTLEEGMTTRSLEELGVEIETRVVPMEEMENEEGALLQQMFRIEVGAVWWEDGEWQEMKADTWRYARLYAQ